jgi:hypothetical protein
LRSSPASGFRRLLSKPIGWLLPALPVLPVCREPTGSG